MQGVPVAQVEATKGALWDAFAETAIYIEILHVQTSSSASAKGEQQLAQNVGLARLHLCSSKLSNPQSLPRVIILSALSSLSPIYMWRQGCVDSHVHPQ